MVITAKDEAYSSRYVGVMYTICEKIGGNTGDNERTFVPYIYYHLDHAPNICLLYFISHLINAFSSYIYIC